LGGVAAAEGELAGFTGVVIGAAEEEGEFGDGGGGLLQVGFEEGGGVVEGGGAEGHAADAVVGGWVCHIG